MKDVNNHKNNSVKIFALCIVSFAMPYVCNAAQQTEIVPLITAASNELHGERAPLIASVSARQHRETELERIQKVHNKGRTQVIVGFLALQALVVSQIMYGNITDSCSRGVSDGITLGEAAALILLGYGMKKWDSSQRDLARQIRSESNDDAL